MSFISKNDILCKKQFGFRQGYSTNLALIDFTDKLAKGFENKQITVGIFLDLSKAFDSIDHVILLKKLQFYGIRGPVLQWFKSYLEARKQFVNIGEYKSDYDNITVGVPQGSILGPLLFLIYINDLQFASNILSIILFADDTNLFLSGKDPSELNNILNAELINIQNWFNANKLQVNYGKTCYMIFKSKKRYIDESAIHISLNGTVIRRVTSTKFLGVIIDSDLTWKGHINHISSKLSQAIGVMNRLKKILLINICVTLYHTMVSPYLTYCIEIWGNCANYLLLRIFLLQKRAVRVITDSHYLAHTDPLFHKLKILKLSDLYRLHATCFVFSTVNGLLPSLFNDYFVYNYVVNRYICRNSNDLNIPPWIYQYSRSTLRYNGSVVWNSLSQELIQSPTLSSFKRKYKMFLLTSYSNP